MKRNFYYLETENEDLLFEFLDDYVSEGFIGYNVDDINGMVTIDNFQLDDDDDIYKILEVKYDLIEDFDYSEGIDHSDFDDFYNDDDYM